MRYYITGIDTGVGKSVVTGLMAAFLMNREINVRTAKLAQTGCEGISEDILTHRRICGVSPDEDDKAGLSCPYVFKFPSSPHYSASLEGKIIDPDIIESNFSRLEKKSDVLFVEGVGGLMVPLTPDYTVLDYIKERVSPVIVVTTPKLGSINHTLLTMKTLTDTNIPVAGIIYNRFISENPDITESTVALLKNRFIRIPLVEIQSVEKAKPDFTAIFQARLL